jgi:dTDP-4-amino-4,6-dideoxygalactose transaminase
MPIPLLDLKGQYKAMETELQAAIAGVLESGAYVLGPAVRDFEAQVAEYVGTKHAIGVASGTDALLLCLMARDVGPGDEVILPTYTFFATAGVVHRLGATPVFVDIDPVHYNIDVEALDAAITERTKAVIPVHLFGQCAPMAPILELCRSKNIAVIEDAAQAIGSAYRGKNAGSIAEFGCFSFYPTKNLGGYGDGGMITTDSDAYADLLGRLRVHGARPKYIHQLVGVNSRLDAIQAAILSVKLPHLDRWAEGRRKHADYYRHLFAGTVVKTPSEAEGCHHVYNQFVIAVSNRPDVMAALGEKGIGCEIYYPLPMHLQECFAYLGYKKGQMPVAEKAAETSLSIPVFPEMTTKMQDEVVATILAVAK